MKRYLHLLLYLVLGSTAIAVEPQDDLARLTAAKTRLAKVVEEVLSVDLGRLKDQSEIDIRNQMQLSSGYDQDMKVLEGTTCLFLRKKIGAKLYPGPNVITLALSVRDSDTTYELSLIWFYGDGALEKFRWSWSIGGSKTEKPNQALEPTSTAVTPPASAGDRASGTRGSS
jgi:hypothetical protein